MSLRTSANRYARALFDVALQEKADLAKIGADLEALADVVREHEALVREVERPGVPDAARKAVASKLSERLGAAPPVAKLLQVLAEAHKLALVPALAAAYQERLRAHRNIVRAEVESAVPLPPDKTQALEASLAAVTGKKVELVAAVNPDLLGGVVARIGSTVYDGSVRTQLKKMRETLTA
jgi:F-type H+-transporting ATPase subunit delta